jgi:DNA-binding NarL/FixJ family response regulator
MSGFAIYSGCPLVAAGLSGLLSTISETFIAGTLSALDAHVAIAQPEYAIIDVDASFSIDQLQRLRENSPEMRSVILVNSIPSELLAHVLSIGVVGVAARNSEPEKLLNCVHAVMRGEMWIDKEFAPIAATTRRVSLTRREREVAGLLVQGLTNKEIAWQLRLTEGSVKVYLSRIFEKTGVADRFALALLVLKNIGSFAPPGLDRRSAGTMVPAQFMLSQTAPAVSGQRGPDFLRVA